MTVELASVAALSENRVIGTDDDVPWDLPADKKQYRERVAGAPVMFGRRTFEMFDDLPGTAQIVLSRSEREFDPSTVYHAGSVAEAVDIADALGADRAHVLGGAAIYELFQPHLDWMFLSRVPGEYDGDDFYPEWNDDEWQLVETTAYPGFRLEEWKRV